MQATEIECARSALHHLDTGCGREKWHRIGRAAIGTGLVIEELESWSSTAGNYAGEQDVRVALKTIKAEGGSRASDFAAAHGRESVDDLFGTSAKPPKAARFLAHVGAK